MEVSADIVLSSFKNTIRALAKLSILQWITIALGIFFWFIVFFSYYKHVFFSKYFLLYRSLEESYICFNFSHCSPPSNPVHPTENIVTRYYTFFSATLPKNFVTRQENPTL
jgi:hypothetical protein